MSVPIRSGLALLAAAAFPLVAVPKAGLPATFRVSVDAAGAAGDGSSFRASISANGRFVAFQSSATNLVPDDTNSGSDVFVRDSRTGGVVRVSVDSDGAQLAEAGEEPSISANGRYVAFSSPGVGVVPGKSTTLHDIIVHDTRTGRNTLASPDVDGNPDSGESRRPSISANGRFVAFESDSGTLVPGDNNSTDDIFVRDLRAGITTRVSLGTNGVQGNSISFHPSISPDGRFVAFASYATKFTADDANDGPDVFVHDRKSGVTTRVSVDSSGQQGNGASYDPSISSGGRWVAFTSESTNLVSVNLLAYAQVFLHDSRTGATTRISGFTNDVEGAGTSRNPVITANGRFVAFASDAPNLVTGDTLGNYDAFVRDSRTGILVRASAGFAGDEPDNDADLPVVSANGRYAAFESDATNLVSGDANASTDIFVRSLR